MVVAIPPSKHTMYDVLVSISVISTDNIQPVPLPL